MSYKTEEWRKSSSEFITEETIRKGLVGRILTLWEGLVHKKEAEGHKRGTVNGGRLYLYKLNE